MSRGYDGPEIDDFRDPSSGRDRDRSYRDSSRGGDHDWQTRTGVRLKLQRLREAEADSDQRSAQSRGYSESGRSRVSPGGRELPTRAKDDRAKYPDRDRSYLLRPSEIQTLTEVGKFRIVSVQDLAKFAYADDRSRMKSDLRKLAQKFLGHSTIEMTADIYTHTSAEAEREAAVALERAIYGDLFPVVPNFANGNNSAALN